MNRRAFIKTMTFTIGASALPLAGAIEAINRPKCYIVDDGDGAIVISDNRGYGVRMADGSVLVTVPTGFNATRIKPGLLSTTYEFKNEK